MEAVTCEFGKSLESFPGCSDSKEKLKQQLSELLIRQWQYIYIEESEVFPLVERALANEDWLRLQNMTPIMDDPICGRRSWYDYERLNRAIEGKYKMQFSGGESHSLNLTEPIAHNWLKELK